MTDTPNPDTQSSAIARANSEHPTISLPPDQLAATERALITARRHMPSSAVEDNHALAVMQAEVARQLNAIEQRMDKWEDLSEGRLSRTELGAIAAAAAAGVGAAGRKDSSPPSSIRSRVKRWQAIAATVVGLLTTVIGADATMGDSRLVRAIIAGVSAAAAVMTEAP